MSDRRRLWIATVRLWKPIARGLAANFRRRQRRAYLYAAGRTRHWSGGKDPRLQIAGGRSRYGGGEYQTRFRQRPARVRPWRADPLRSRRAQVSFPNQQSQEGGRSRGLRNSNGRAGADSDESESAQREIPRNQKSEDGPHSLAAV